MKAKRKAAARLGALACGSSIALVAVVGVAATPAVEQAPLPGGLHGTEPLLERRAPARASRSRAVRPAAYRGRDGELITEMRLRRFLSARGSPMAPHAERIVRAGIRYGVDPRVVVAIAGVESSFGLHARGHNAWGWGRARWPSWGAAIDRYTRSLAAGYRSLRTGRFSRASRTYCPPCGHRWARGASRIFSSI